MNDVGERLQRYAEFDGEYELAEDFARTRRDQCCADEHPAPPALTLEAAERDQILRALDAAGGQRIAAAKLLGLSRRTLYRKLDRHGIP